MAPAGLDKVVHLVVRDGTREETYLSGRVVHREVGSGRIIYERRPPQFGPSATTTPSAFPVAYSPFDGRAIHRSRPKCGYCGGCKGWDDGGGCKGCGAPKADAVTQAVADTPTPYLPPNPAHEQLIRAQDCLQRMRQEHEHARGVSNRWATLLHSLGGLF